METIAKLKAGSLTPRAQNEREATYAPMLKKEDGLIDWRLPAVVIERRVRGLSPWPSAYTQLDGRLLKIHRATVIQSEPGATPGEVVRADKFALWINTGEAVLSLDEVQLENKKRLPAADFLRGAKIEKGARL
jgi:methionyl-tRNA formyltransferase